MTPTDAERLKASLYARALEPEHRAELQSAAHAWFGARATAEEREEGWLDFLDFFALEWVDAEGLTLLERCTPPSAATRRWLTGARTGVFVVDGQDPPLTWIRDVLTEEDLALSTDEELPPRTVIQGRLLPDEKGAWTLSGDPDLYAPAPVLARLQLANAWAESPRKQLVDRLSALRQGYVLLREQRAAWVEWFGADVRVFPDAASLERDLDAFLRHFLTARRLDSLDGLTAAEHHRVSGRGEPADVRLELGPSLAGATGIGAIYDAREGLHLLPGFAAFRAHLRGELEAADVVRDYVEDPGVTRLPFDRVLADGGSTARLAAAMGVPDGPLEALLAPHKDLTRRPSPSVLPGFDG